MPAPKQEFSFVLRRRLKAYLQLHSLSARQLALQTNVPYTTLANWLEGRMPRNLDQLKRVAAYLGLSLDALCYQAEDSEHGQTSACLISR